MPSSYSSRLRLELQADGENNSLWGQKVNTIIELLEEAMDGYLAKSVAGSSDVTLTATNGSSDESRQRLLKFTGTLTGNIGVIVPTAERVYMVWNATEGAFSLTVKTSAGTGIAVPQGGKALLFCDGTNVEAFATFSSFGLSILDDADAAAVRTTIGAAASSHTHGVADLTDAGSLAAKSTINNSDWSGTDLAIANGGTGASDEATARANLELGDLAVLDTVDTAQIDDEAVTLAKMQHISSARLLGRSTASTGDVEQLTVGSGLSLSGGALACTVVSEVVQVANTQTGATDTSSATMPVDDTIPQITEGAEFMSLAFTPTNASNKLKIEVVFFGQGTSNNGPMAVALFKAGTASALAAGVDELYDEGVRPQGVSFTHWMTAGTTSQITFSVRAGCQTGSIRFNGAGSSRYLGGVLASSITITEYRP